MVNLTSGDDGSEIEYNKTYTECKLWIKENKPNRVKTLNDYKLCVKSGESIYFLTITPNRVFSDWVTCGDYLGTGNVQSSIREYLGYEEAKEYIKNNYKINKVKEYKILNLPNFLSKNLNKIYKEWIGCEDYLGYKSKNRKRNHDILDYDSAKKWIK